VLSTAIAAYTAYLGAKAYAANAEERAGRREDERVRDQAKVSSALAVLAQLTEEIGRSADHRHDPAVMGLWGQLVAIDPGDLHDTRLIAAVLDLRNRMYGVKLAESPREKILRELRAARLELAKRLGQHLTESPAAKEQAS
jgi:hypothetical protein